MGVCANVKEEQLADVAVGDEGFFAVQNPLVAMTLRPQFDAGLGVVIRRQAVVGAATRLRYSLTQHEGIVGEERLEKPFLLLIGAYRRNKMAPLPALAEGLGNGAIAFGKLRHHQSLRHKIDAVAAPLLGNRRRPKAELGAFLDKLPVEGLAWIGDLIALQ